MTIKNQDKNVSGENHEDVVVNASLNNGILTLIRKNLYDESTNAQKNIEVDLSDHKLKLKVLENETELRTLEESDDEDDIKEKQSYVFLVPFESDEEGIYREYIWIEDENDINGGEFEVIGSTKVDLTNYIQKSQTNGLIKNTGEIDTTSYASDSELNSAINGLMNAFGGRIAPLESLKIIKSNGNYYLDVNGTQKGATIKIPDITGKEDASNKVTTISSSSTNTQYPSAKAVYDELPKTTKTLTVTYTNGTTEDIEFYIK